MKQLIHHVLAVLAGALVLSGCSSYSKVTERRPHFLPIPPRSGTLAKAESLIAKCQQCAQREPLVALGGYVGVAEAAAQQLGRNPKDAAAQRDYNFAVARIMTTIRDAKLDPWSKPLTVPGEGGSYVLTHKPDPRPQWNPALYDFTPTDQFDVGGTYVTERSIREGIGAPLVAIGRELNKDAAANFAPKRSFYSVTAMARFEGRRCVLSFDDPLATETTRLGGHTYSLAADFTVPLAVMLAANDPKKLELARMLQPEKYAQTAQIKRLQPYDPNKTVLLVIHGLMDSPATWTPMINALRADADFRRHYQVWFYSYPSGYPYPYSAAILRHELDEIQKKFPMRKKMVVVGHSMGGCISRLLITDTGDDLWLKIFGKPPAQVPLSEHTKKMFTDALIFKHRPEVGRVIFISAPLRGSDLATGWAGRLAASLMKAPVTFLGASRDLLRIRKFDEGDLKLKRIPNSVDTLAPNNRFVKAINTFPLTPGIPYHSIMGDRGKGDTPKSSDGIVPYWSSHLDGAQSELIVPSDHGAHRNPQAIAEVARILKKYAE